MAPPIAIASPSENALMFGVRESPLMNATPSVVDHRPEGPRYGGI